jgi:hypothetical protein
VILSKKALTTHYNGIKIVQARDYIQIHIPPYIDKILENHGWNEEGKSYTWMIEPLYPSSIKELETSEGKSDPVEAHAINKVVGFAYRTRHRLGSDRVIEILNETCPCTVCGIEERL